MHKDKNDAAGFIPVFKPAKVFTDVVKKNVKEIKAEQ